MIDTFFLGQLKQTTTCYFGLVGKVDHKIENPHSILYQYIPKLIYSAFSPMQYFEHQQ